MTRSVAIIPARGGSKGVPRKNVQRVGGIPLVARAVLAARESGVIDLVVVTTDDDEIASVAREHGATIVRRPAEISGDEASSESALLHALDVLDEDGPPVGVIAFLQATSPFIDAAALRRAVEDVREKRLDSVFAAVETYGFLWSRDPSSSTVSAVNHDAERRPRRQDRDPHLLETGAFYVMSADGFRAAGHRFFGRVGAVEVREGTEIEIDTHDELERARALAPFIAAPEAIDVDALVTDFDGVHTDDTARVDDAGRESVRVSRSDGMGTARLRAAGIPVLIVSSEENPVVARRAAKLRIDVRHGVGDKAGVIREWAHEQGIPLSRVAFVGNDVNDLAALELVGWPIAVPDAHPLVVAAARQVLTRAGGHGAVREVAERLLAARTEQRVDSERSAP